MRFHDIETMWMHAKANGILKTKFTGGALGQLQEFYHAMDRKFYWYEGGDDLPSPMQASFEMNWIESKKPYYNVYPSAADMLSKIDLSSVKAGQLSCPSGINPLLVRLPETNNPLHPVRLISIRKNHNGIFFFGINLGAKYEFKYEGHCFSGDSFHQAAASPHWESTLEGVKKYFKLHEEHGPNETSLAGNDEVVEKAVKLAVTLCLLGDSPELIQPEVLNADEHKLQGQHNIEALVAKARRRGKYGFTIGKDIEVMPHYRRPHLALVWYGPGKKKSKVIPRKGSIVHRSKVEKIPTGYAAEEVEA